MSNHLTAVIVPASVVSGSPVQVTADYESDDGGALHISCGGGFSLSPGSKTFLSTPSGSSSFALTITRTNATTKCCRLVFGFFSSQREALVEVK